MLPSSSGEDVHGSTSTPFPNVGAKLLQTNVSQACVAHIFSYFGTTSQVSTKTQGAQNMSNMKEIMSMKIRITYDDTPDVQVSSTSKTPPCFKQATAAPKSFSGSGTWTTTKRIHTASNRPGNSSAKDSPDWWRKVIRSWSIVPTRASCALAAAIMEASVSTATISESPGKILCKDRWLYSQLHSQSPEHEMGHSCHFRCDSLPPPRYQTWQKHPSRTFESIGARELSIAGFLMDVLVATAIRSEIAATQADRV